MYTLNDYFDSPVIISYGANNIDANRKNTFPSVSLCIEKEKINYMASTEREKKFIQNDYAEHNITEPKV